MLFSLDKRKRKKHEANIQAEAYRQLRNKGINVELERRMRAIGQVIIPDMVILKDNGEPLFIVEFKHDNFDMNGFISYSEDLSDQLKLYLKSGYFVYVCSGFNGIGRLLEIF